MVHPPSQRGRRRCHGWRRLVDRSPLLWPAPRHCRGGRPRSLSDQRRRRPPEPARAVLCACTRWRRRPGAPLTRIQALVVVDDWCRRARGHRVQHEDDGRMDPRTGACPGAGRWRFGRLASWNPARVRPSGHPRRSYVPRFRLLDARGRQLARRPPVHRRQQGRHCLQPRRRLQRRRPCRWRNGWTGRWSPPGRDWRTPPRRYPGRQSAKWRERCSPGCWRHHRRDPGPVAAVRRRERPPDRLAPAIRPARELALPLGVAP